MSADYYNHVSDIDDAIYSFILLYHYTGHGLIFVGTTPFTSSAFRFARGKVCNDLDESNMLWYT